MGELLTIGHSTHPITVFLALLQQHGVGAVVDVRSAPFSRYNPQFNRADLTASLRSIGIRYVFLGKELGARSDDPDCYRHDKVQYDVLAETSLFKTGIDRVLAGANLYRVALMCAERDPLQCHRTILVSRELVKRGAEVKHILFDGRIETHENSILRLMAELGVPTNDLFRSKDELVAESYAKQAARIAYDRSDQRRESTDSDNNVLERGASK